MNYSVDINLNFSIFGLIIFGLLLWGAYRGYKHGGIVMALSVFALLIGLVISASLAHFTYMYFWKVGSKVPDVFGSVILGISFILAIWFANFIRKIVHIRIKEAVAQDKTNNIIGAIFGTLKLFLIIGVYSIVILNLDYNGNFLPPRDKKSYLMNTSAWIMTHSIKLLQMDYHRQVIPQGPNLPKNKGIIFPTHKNKTNTTKQLIENIDDNNP
jgi:hypothetical protein